MGVPRALGYHELALCHGGYQRKSCVFRIMIG